MPIPTIGARLPNGFGLKLTRLRHWQLWISEDPNISMSEAPSDRGLLPRDGLFRDGSVIGRTGSYLGVVHSPLRLKANCLASARDCPPIETTFPGSSTFDPPCF